MSGRPDSLSAPAPADEGGEAACLLPLLCPACGRVPDGPPGRTCAACGADLEHDDPALPSSGHAPPAPD